MGRLRGGGGGTSKGMGDRKGMGLGQWWTLEKARGRGGGSGRSLGDEMLSQAQGLTVVRVDAQLNFPLNGSLDLLFPHALDAQVVKAEWGKE